MVYVEDQLHIGALQLFHEILKKYFYPAFIKPSYMYSHFCVVYVALYRGLVVFDV